MVHIRAYACILLVILLSATREVVLLKSVISRFIYPLIIEVATAYIYLLAPHILIV